MAKKTWVSVLIAAGIIVVVLCAAAIGGGAYFMRRHVRAEFVKADSAAGEFARVRTRFEGQRPMIEITSGEIVDAANESHADIRTIVHREPAGAGAGPINSIHVMAFDGRTGKLVQADVPRWLLSLGSAGGRLRLANLDLSSPDFDRITLDDLDHRGPGLILDLRRMRQGTEVLVWSD